MGFEPINKPTAKRGENACPIDGRAMTGNNSMIARLPKGTHTEIRMVCIFCVPFNSPSYSRAVELATRVGG